jgi:hypothetical protein
MIKTPLTGVDATTAYTVSFSSSQAILSTSILVPSNPRHAVTIRYQHGTITIPMPIFAPKEFTVTYSVSKEQETKTVKVDWEGGGWHFQADEVARCVRDGKLQSADWGWDKSTLEMEIFDEVCMFRYIFSSFRPTPHVMFFLPFFSFGHQGFEQKRLLTNKIDRFGGKVDTSFLQGLKMSSEVHNVCNLSSSTMK